MAKKRPRKSIGKQKRLVGLFFILFFLSLQLSQHAKAQADSYTPTTQSPTLLYNEARTVYLGNLERQANGVPPLRWNTQLTHAARWFSWDSVENRPIGFCGHEDSQGNDFSYRTDNWGYLGFAGAENAFCGYVSPEYAIQGWMNSAGHRTNLLNSSYREIGMGYYRRDSDGRGYLTQDFGRDKVYAPVVIENEALATTDPNVSLYIYDRQESSGFAGFSAATQMMVSDNPYFNNASWEAFNNTKAWSLENNIGWQDVYVKTRDAFGRTMTVSDTIYFGTEASLPTEEIGTGEQLSTTSSNVTLYELDGGSLSNVQFSLGWLADNSYSTFSKLWGNGNLVNDAAALGGTAYRLYPGAGESAAWVYDTSFVPNVPMVAYFRLKVNDNASTAEVARLAVEGGQTDYGPISLKGTDFDAPNQYQEFALNFTFDATQDDQFLIFRFWRSGTADLYVDAVSIFTMPQAVAPTLTWSVPGNNYRGQGVWVRYTEDDQFSAISEGITVEPEAANVQSILRTDADHTYATSVDFTVSFSEPVTGVDSGDFLLTSGGDVSGASITDVNGEDDVYTVSVATGTGSGTLRLDLSDNDSIQDAGSKPLGGVGEHNGDYTAGESYTLEKGHDSFYFPENFNVSIYTHNATTTAATSNPTDPALPVECGVSGRGQATVWYKYTPQSDTAISIDTLASTYDTFIAVWEGTSLETLEIRACNNNASSATTRSQVGLQVFDGHSYYIEIGQP